MERKYNLKSPAVKRLMREAKELCKATEQYFAQPLEDNLFEWHFTVQGPADSDFESGRYHGRIVLPPEYPMKPPSIMLLTPNGRFEIGKKVCLSMSAHHPETWQPSWSIRTVLLAIIGFMPSKGGGAIGALDYTPKERKVLAKKSILWKCNVCGSCNADSLKEVEPGSHRTTDKEAQKLASQISFKSENEKKSESSSDVADGAAMTYSTSSPTHASANTSNGEKHLERAGSAPPSIEEITPGTLEGETARAASGERADAGLRKRISKNSSAKRDGQSGQNGRVQLDERSSTSRCFSTTLIMILTACLVLLLLRRIYKQDYSESA